MKVQHDQAKSIFLSAVEIAPPEERRALIEARCGGDDALRAEVEDLLVHHQGLGAFLQDVPAGLTADFRAAEGPGTLIGPYKLLEQIGEGGMGTVWMAEQTEPVKRRVALKLIKPGMDTGQVLARFEAERQALALMDHPNIAKVFDAGTTPGGRPFFVMELVKGIPITRYCDEHMLTPKERLELFVQVCQAIQHAHQKGIIHRDIKPNNVLVARFDDKAVPKVIDFGVAKATGEKLTERTMFTSFGGIVGTLEYMSPEQAQLNQLDIDTRSDIYALGILLYELLTGSTPLTRQRVKEAAQDEVLRLIREEEPPRPSARLSSSEALPSLAAQRQMEPAKLTRMLCGEPDWMVMKALEKDRSRRYETANAFARDIERYLHDEPVEAGPPSARYRLWKLARKYRTPLRVAGAFLLLLFAAVLVSSWLAVRATLAETAAEEGREKAVQEENKAKASEEQAQKERMDAEKARALADQRGQELYRNLYVAEMNLAGDAIQSVGGVGRASEYLAKWRDSKPDLRGWEWYYLDRLSRTDLRTLRGHSHWVSEVAWSPDGFSLASASADGTARIWNALSGKLILTLPGHSAGLWALTWSPDGKRLATASVDGTVKVWEAHGGKLLRTLNGQHGAVRAVAWSPDGQRLAAGCEDGNVRVWSADDGQDLLTYRAGKTAVIALGWRPDSQRIATASKEGPVKIWDPATGKEFVEFKLVDPSNRNVVVVRGLAWSPDGKRLATASDGFPPIGIWDVETGKLLNTLSGHQRGVSTVSWAPDGKRLVSGSRGDWTVRVWDTALGKQLGVFRGHSGPVSSVSWSPVGPYVASASSDETVKVWDVSGNDQNVVLRGVNDQISTMTWSPDGKRIAASGPKRAVKIWDPDTAKEIHSLSGHTNWVWRVAWSPNSALLASLGDEVIIWDAASGQRLRTLEGGERGLGWNKDGTRVACVWKDLIKVWDVGTGREVMVLQGHVRIYAVAFSPDGLRIAAACHDSTVKTWDAVTGKELRTFRGHTDRKVRYVAWSPDGLRLASCSDDGTIKIWDAATGEALFTLRGHTSIVSHVAWSPDGKRLASASEDNVKIWDPDNGSILLTLRDNIGEVSSVAWSPDGKRLASAGWGGVVVIHDARPR